MFTPKSHGIALKKKHGQNFLRDESVIHCMLDRVKLTAHTSVFEIGPGDGFLTQYILDAPISRLWSFEIDPEWVGHLRKRFEGNKFFTVFEQNILDVDFSMFDPYKPWTLLANLPYHVTIPILHRMQQHRRLLTEGVIMVQEEMAQKIVKKGGRDYGYVSLFFQYYFEWELLVKVPPHAFFPAPKVYSRLMYFKPKQNIKEIPDDQGFWKFIKACFHQPRRTLRNNLQQYHYDLNKISDEKLALRAQQMTMDDLLAIWDLVREQK